MLAVDPELDSLTYAWTVVSTAPGANAVLATPSAATCAVSGMTVAGDYLFNIAVSDASRTTSKQVKVPVLAGNQPPGARRRGQQGPGQSVVLPTTTTTLTGGGYDIEGDALDLPVDPRQPARRGQCRAGHAHDGQLRRSRA